jgi:hypothetical protein
MVAAALIGGGVWVWSSRAPDPAADSAAALVAAASAETVPASPAAGERRGQAVSARPVAVAPAEEAPPAVEPAPPPEATEPPAAAEPTPEAAVAASERPRSTSKKKRSARKKRVAGSSRTKKKSGPAFNTNAARQSLGSAAANASGCRKGAAGSGKAQVTFDTSGRVSAARIVSGPFAGTPTGTCAMKHFRAARVPAFSGKPVTVAKSFRVR